jgi:hypothetical protein
VPYPTELAPNVEFLSLKTAVTADLGDRALTQLMHLQSNGFVAGLGLSEAHIPTVAAMTREEHIVEYCPNDEGRMGTVEDAKDRWQPKGRGFVGIYDVKEWDGRVITPGMLRQLKDEDVEMIAYGWSGELANSHAPDFDITTAYRAGQRGLALARERSTPRNKLRMGLALGEIVVASTKLYGADPKRVALEHWHSNGAAANLYHEMGFEAIAVERDIRPTLRKVGEVINNQVVQHGEIKGKPAIVVPDLRVHRVLKDHPLVD